MDDEKELESLRIAEAAKERLIAWLKWYGGIFAAIVVLFGFRAWLDYQTALNSIDKKIDRALNTKIEAYSKDLTSELLAAIVTVRVKAREIETTLDSLEERTLAQRNQLEDYQGKLTQYEREALDTLDKFRKSLEFPISEAEVERQLTEKQAAFVQASKAYRERIGVQTLPRIIFLSSDRANILAKWDPEHRRYEVNPGSVDIPGLPEHIALMGDFYAKNWERCAAAQQLDVDFWNNFRYGLTTYLLQTESPSIATDSPVLYPPLGRRIADRLKAVQEASGDDAEPVRQLALALLNTFQCDWKYEDYIAEALRVNESNKLLEPEALEKLR